MKNTGQIVRSKKNGKSRYTPISNNILQSKTLTAEQKSILVHLLSLPEDWVVYKTEIWKDMNIGRDRFNKSWSVLVELGYIVSVKMIDSTTNLIKGYNHIVYEEPASGLPSIGLTEIQATRNSECIQSTDLQSNNLQSNNLQSNKVLDTRTSIEKFDELDMFSEEAQKLADEYLKSKI
jgi:hypothetical protein